jgi:hypothetical protein
MTGVRDKVYVPEASSAAAYAQLYKVYGILHDAFGTSAFGGTLAGVMKDLIRIRAAARRTV